MWDSTGLEVRITPVDTQSTPQKQTQVKQFFTGKEDRIFAKELEHFAIHITSATKVKTVARFQIEVKNSSHRTLFRPLRSFEFRCNADK
jgi:hypothetical protein